MSPSAHVTKNFTFDEFGCNCGTCSYADGYQIDRNLVLKLQAIRDALKEPIRITSGLRCFDRNQLSGGVETSFHLVGKAVDVVCSDSVRRHRLVAKALDLGLTVGISNHFIHLDNRELAKIFLY